MQQLFLVVGGELSEIGGVEFRDPATLHFVGTFPTYEEARQEWRSNAQRTVDNALMRYYVLPMHKLIEPLRPAPTAAEQARQFRKRNEESPLEPLSDLP